LPLGPLLGDLEEEQRTLTIFHRIQNKVVGPSIYITKEKLSKTER